MKKMAIVRTGFPRLKINGYNVQEIGFAKGLLQWGVSTDIYSQFEDVDRECILARENDSRIRLRPLSSGFHLIAGITYHWGLIKQLQTENYDVIQVNGQAQLMSPLILHFFHNRVKTSFLEGLYSDYKGWKNILQNVYDWFFKKWINEADFVFAKTPKCKDYLESKGYKNVKLLSVGLDTERFQKTKHRNNHGLKAFAAKYEKLILYVGRLEERRRPDFLIDVFRYVSMNTKNVGLVVVGQGPCAELFDGLVGQFDLSESVLRLSYVKNDEMSEIYDACDLLILPTQYEIYGMVVLEALYHGLPVIASESAGPSAIIKQSCLGAILQKWSVDEWGHVVMNYLQQNKADFAKERKRIIDTIYNWQIIAGQLLRELKHHS